MIELFILIFVFLIVPMPWGISLIHFLIWKKYWGVRIVKFIVLILALSVWLLFFVSDVAKLPNNISK